MKNIFKSLNKITKTLFFIALIFIMYGYLCRIIGLYFFWESRSIGWAFLIIGGITLLLNRIKSKNIEKKNTVGEKIGIGVLIFIVFVGTLLLIVIPNTDAYAAAKIFLINNKELKAEVGNINSFGLIPSGGIQIETSSGGESGNATINLTVKGNEKYKDLTIYLVKYINGPEWKVDSFE